MRIAVIGCGYVGLVAGTCLADSGNEVCCVDVDRAKIAALEAGVLPIYEPGLDELVKKNVREQRLRFTTVLSEAVAGAAVVFIAVGTPEGESGEADLTYVLAAAREIARALTGYTVIVDKSTVPVGTAEQVRAVAAANTTFEFDVVSNPEFLKEGAALEDFLKPDRVVIGTSSQRARALMERLYAPFVRTEHPILFMDPRSAELTKYAANAMLATRISFMNQLARLCEQVDADVDLVRKGLGADRRIGYPFLFPGVGYGGSCFPKDVRALQVIAREHGVDFKLLEAVEETNAHMKGLLLERAKAHFGSLTGRTFAVWGLAFKPKTDDLREASSLVLIEGLLAAGATVRVYDPVAMDQARKHLGARVHYAAHPYDALERAEALFVVTEWNEFRHPDLERMKRLMATPVLFDGRNLYAPAQLAEAGFTHHSIGRPRPTSRT